MLRVLLTIVLPLTLPTAIYIAWVAFTSRSENREKLRLGAMPLVWLVLAGVALLAAVLVTVTVHFGEPVSGRYVPPRYEDGRVVPPHLEPLQKQ
jgi:predicted membrane-bound mannosyltransferase